MLDTFKYQTLERCGFVTQWSSQTSEKIIHRLKKRKNLRWLNEKTIEDEIQQFFIDKGIRLYWGTPKFVHRKVCQKLGAFILKQCAKEHNFPLTNVRPLANNREFIIHDFMSSKVLIEDHANTINAPKGETSFWQSSNYKSWSSSISQIDALIPDMNDQFENTFSEWIESGLIVKKDTKDKPFKSVLYEVKTN